MAGTSKKAARFTSNTKWNRSLMLWNRQQQLRQRETRRFDFTIYESQSHRVGLVSSPVENSKVASLSQKVMRNIHRHHLMMNWNTLVHSAEQKAQK